MRAQRAGEAPETSRADVWEVAERTSVPLGPIPLDAQIDYVRAAWADRPYGTVRDVIVSAARDESRVSVLFEWESPGGGEGEFPDAAAVIFRRDGDTPASAFGSPDAPVRLWLWRSNVAGALNLLGRGPGVFHRSGEDGVTASAEREGQRWKLVLTGPAEEATERMSVAVWDGSNEERAGIGAVAGGWIPLRLD